jgi:hypothetical protein
MSMLSSLGWDKVGMVVRNLPIPGAGAIGTAIGALAGTTVSRAAPQLPFGLGGGPIINMPTPGGRPIPGPGGVPTPGFGNTSVTACPKGYHLNKHALAPTKRHGGVAAHSMCVRNRKINPLNHRALSRSLRRLKRAGKLVRKLHGVGGQRRLTAGSSGRSGHRPGCGCFACKRR